MNIAEYQQFKIGMETCFLLSLCIVAIAILWQLIELCRELREERREDEKN